MSDDAVELCALCRCKLNRNGEYATPSVQGRSHATSHHYVPERFFGRSKNRPGDVREAIFSSCPWNLEGKEEAFCYECHEELIHNPVFLPSDIELFSRLVAARDLTEREKPDGRAKIAGRIRLLHEVIETGLRQLIAQESNRKSEQARGSLRWIRVAVNEATAVLDRHVKTALHLHATDTIKWVSPLREEGYEEYCDEAFLKKLDIELKPKSLFQFWPRSGPRWDALGSTSTGTRLLVEAKANVPELVSPGTGAGGDSRALIEKSLVETQRFLGVDEVIPWSGKLYQYANRLSHLYFLRERCGIDAHLIFIYFVNDPDMKGPKTEAEWRAAIAVAEKVLGLGKGHALSEHVSDVFIDVRELA